MPTRLGWTLLTLLAGIAFAAINTGNNLLYLLVGIGLAAFAVSSFAAGRGLGRLTLELSRPEEIVALERTSLVFTLRHRGGRAASPAVHCTLLASSVPLPPFSLPSIPAGGSLVRFVGATFPRRGRVLIDRIRLETTDPFGLITRSVKPRLHDGSPASVSNPQHRAARRAQRSGGSGAADLLVYPAPSSPAEAETARGESRSERVSRRVGDGLELHQIRAARFDDDSRHLDWRATARVGELMVKECLEEGATQLTLVFDPSAPVDSPAVRGRFEALVSEAAALVWRCADRNLPLRFIAPENEFRDLDPPGGHRPILDYLAQVEPTFGPASALLPDLEGEPGIVRLAIGRGDAA